MNAFEEWYLTQYTGHDAGLLTTYGAALAAWNAAIDAAARLAAKSDTDSWRLERPILSLRAER